MRKGWSFSDPDGIEQCRDEGWTDKMKEQSMEGCRMSGRVRVNKVSRIASFHDHNTVTTRYARSGADYVGYREPTFQPRKVIPE